MSELWTSEEMECSYVCRYRHEEPLPCTVQYRQVKHLSNYEAETANEAETKTEMEIVVNFRRADNNVCPGQILALYDGEVCLGGGPINKPGPSCFEQQNL